LEREEEKTKEGDKELKQVKKLFLTGIIFSILSSLLVICIISNVGWLVHYSFFISGEIIYDYTYFVPIYIYLVIIWIFVLCCLVRLLVENKKGYPEDRR